MAVITIQVLEGLERGEVFADLKTPITIGREDENMIRLNDERVSRFHAKIQEDGDRIILTDLDSTNGTRVNGHPVSMRILQYGDQIVIGRCLLIYGNNEQISERLVEIQSVQSLPENPANTMQLGSSHGSGVAPEVGDERGELFPTGAPELPVGLKAVQKAQLSDLLGFAHDRIRAVLESAVEDTEQTPPVIKLDWATWQRLSHLEMSLAKYLRRVAEPDD
jgi:pSer/pThr/pTyr-binding forkhead associated (FHA) protein